MNPRCSRISAASRVANRPRSGARAALALVAAGALACGFAAPAQAADGWQGNSSFDVPAGRQGQQYGRDCPVGYTAVSGAFAFNAVGQQDSITLSFNGQILYVILMSILCATLHRRHLRPKQSTG